tara:strand:+ start:787 stop:1410 length:624 start_codon:yes stop_codon:yes gene_type:complete
MANFIKTFILISSFSLSQHLIPKTSIDSNGDINSINYYRVIGNKIKLVKKEEYYSNGQKKVEINFKNKEKNGIVRGWDILGKLEREEYYINDLKNGLCIYWFSNGQKKEEVIFKNGKKNGLFSGWYQNGNKRCEINYINDDRDGLSIYWYQNGSKKGEENWKLGLPIGRWSEWHDNGKVFSEGVFRLGKLISKSCWDETGSKIDCAY